MFSGWVTVRIMVLLPNTVYSFFKIYLNRPLLNLSTNKVWTQVMYFMTPSTKYHLSPSLSSVEQIKLTPAFASRLLSSCCSFYCKERTLVTSTELEDRSADPKTITSPRPLILPFIWALLILVLRVLHSLLSWSKRCVLTVKMIWGALDFWVRKSETASWLHHLLFIWYWTSQSALSCLCLRK